MFLILEVGYGCITSVRGCQRVYLHARIYVGVGGARASHLCGMRCYIPNGVPQRESEGKE